MACNSVWYVARIKIDHQLAADQPWAKAFALRAIRVNQTITGICIKLSSIILAYTSWTLPRRQGVYKTYLGPTLYSPLVYVSEQRGMHIPIANPTANVPRPINWRPRLHLRHHDHLHRDAHTARNSLVYYTKAICSDM